MEQLQQETTQVHPVIRWICNVMIGISAVALGIMMIISVADVIGRYFFLHPIEGTSELVASLMLVASALGLGYTQLLKGNISIDVLTGRFNRRGQGILNIISFIMSIVISAIICWQGSLMAHEYMFKQLGGKSAILGIVLWPFIALMSLGFAWVTVIFIIDLYHSIVGVLKR